MDTYQLKQENNYLKWLIAGAIILMFLLAFQSGQHSSGFSGMTEEEAENYSEVMNSRP